MKGLRSFQFSLWSVRVVRVVVALSASLVAACGGGYGGGSSMGSGGMSSSAPTITTQPTSQMVHAPATATFTVMATSPAGYGVTYQWFRGTTMISSANMASYTTGATSVAADNGATFYVNVTNTYGTTKSTTVTLTVM